MNQKILKTCKCSRCGVEKESFFYSRICEECISAYRKRYYHEHREKMLQQTKDWREKNIERYREQQRLYFEKRLSVPQERSKHNSRNVFSRNFRNYIGSVVLGIDAVEKPRKKTIEKMEKLIGCSVPLLVSRMEKKWLKRYGVEINWNHMFIPSCPDKIEIEHITDLAYFNFDEVDAKSRAFYFANLEALKQKDNRTGRPIRFI